MSRVVNNNRGFLQLLADCPAYQRQFLLKTATPQQLHALVQVLYNMVVGHIPIPEENKRILLPYKDALLRIFNAIKEVTHRYVEHSKRSLSLVLIKMKRKIDLVEEEHQSEHEESESSGNESGEDEELRIKEEP